MPKRRGFCFICKGSNDGISVICTRPACLAQYWRDEAKWAKVRAERYAKECIARAERIEQDAALAAAPSPATTGETR